MIEITGIPSGDYEVETFDVPYEDFVKVEGQEPKEYDKSHFYVGLYRLYSVPTCKAFRDYDERKLVKITYDDFGIKSMEKTDVIAKYIYDGYENNEWFS